jgi:L-iditol 2-dehydrogenase
MSAIKKKYDFAALNTHYYPFDQLNEAMDVACKLKSDAFKVMLTFGVDE